MAYLKDAREREEIDVEQGAAFFEIASWLVLLKSRALLPEPAAKKRPSASLPA